MEKKYSSHISVLLLTFVLVFAMSGFLFPQTVHADYCEINGVPMTSMRKEACENLAKIDKKNTRWVAGTPPTSTGQAAVNGLRSGINKGAEVVGNILLAPIGWLALLILQIATLLTGLGGMILNYATQFTIVDMAKNIRNIGSIDTAWKTIRDVANMGFIFILLYAAIKTILGIGDDVKKLIVNIVIVAILINFSLFFTKVVIDASNVLSTLFYDAIAPTSLTDSGFNVGLSGKMMGPLQLSSLWDTGNIGVFETKGNIIIGVMGTIVSLIVAFVFFAVAIMFVIRFIVLIFVMILSPLAFMGYILPQLKGHKDDWIQALLGQAFFAPIYFMLTWIVIQISESLLPLTKASAGGTMATAFLGAVGADGNTTPPPIGSIALLMNFIIMIVFLIASLVIAKQWADKVGHGVPALTKWATGFAGGAVFGGLGWTGRSTLGRLGAATAENVRLQEAANKKTGLAGAGARLALYASRKARSGSFDARSATIPTNAIGDLVEGTVGRTKIGKGLGLNDVNIPSMRVGALAADQTDVGIGGTKGYQEIKKESAKRVLDREAAYASELAQAQAKRDVTDGAKTGATPAQIDAMEKALAKLSDKQTETLVANNRELLESQNFANSISVKQLEALNKSDQFSDTEKDTIKNARFSIINTAMAPGGAGATAIRANIRRLSDTELEMINPSHLSSADFVSQLQSAQIDTINKSPKFTTSQKGNLRTARRAQLLAALGAGNVHNAEIAVKSLGHKEIAALDMPDLVNTTMLQTYTPQLLKRMAPEMNPADIAVLRAAILAGGNPGTVAWLSSPDGNIFL